MLLLPCLFGAAEAPPVAGEPIEQTVGERVYFYVSVSTTLDKVKDAYKQAVPKLRAGMQDSLGRVSGPMIGIYHNMDLTGKPFTLDIGFPVAEATQPAGDFKVKKLEPF